MVTLQEKYPVWHAVAWIGIYVIAVNIGDWLSAMMGQPNSVTSAVLVLLSAWLLVDLGRRGWLAYYGVRPLRRADFRSVLLYVPLALIISMQFTKGIKEELTVTAVLLIVVLMICVGFLEELIFRGMLLRGIQRTSTLTRAIVISGITFGVGHVVNLARGMTPLEQSIQVGFGIVLGIVLALLFAVTGTIVPLIVFHALLNISGNITVGDTTADMLMLVATTVVCIGYALYLVAVLRRRGPAEAMTQPAPTMHVPVAAI